MKLIKRNNKECELKLVNGKITSPLRIGQRDTIFFVCSRCEKEGSRRVSLWKSLENLIDRDFYCQVCNREQNSLDLYGVRVSTQRPEIKEKIKKIFIEKYGVDNPMKNLMIAKKSSETKRKFSYNVRKSKFSNVEFLENFDNYEGTKKTYLWRCKECDNEFSYNTQNPKLIPRCQNCMPANISKKQSDLNNFIKSLGFKTIINDREILKPYEIDIFIPELNFGIEFNGLIWHSFDAIKKRNLDGINYHKNKLEKSLEKGMRLIQIFEDEWDYKNDIVKNRIKSILGKNENRIGARNCIIEEIDSSIKNEFLEKYHIQGADKSNIKLGAFYNKELIGLITFSKPRIALGGKIENNKWELSRFVTKANCSTPGLASKLLNFFIKKYTPSIIYSYADRRWSIGELYSKLGFKNSGFTEPNYWYFKESGRRHRFGFRKSMLVKMKSFSKEKTEFQIMKEEGFFRIYDCGNIKFTKEYLW